MHLWHPNNIATRSVADLDLALRSAIHMIPEDVGLIVGIPRSGMLPASLLSTYLNIPLVDIDGYLCGSQGAAGSRPCKNLSKNRGAALIVDDSIATGAQIKIVRQQLESRQITSKYYFLAVFGTREANELVDIICEEVTPPRIFSWNAVNSWVVSQACVDIDGLLCPDPTDAENDDNGNYEKFLTRTSPLYSCRYKIKHIVTSRLEKYRNLTEEWLKRNEIEYELLHMVDLPSASERKKRGPLFHAKNKARIYRSLPETRLFLESAPWQAKIISQMSGKVVFCSGNGIFYHPDRHSIRYEQLRHYILNPRSLAGLLKQLAGL